MKDPIIPEASRYQQFLSNSHQCSMNAKICKNTKIMATEFRTIVDSYFVVNAVT